MGVNLNQSTGCVSLANLIFSDFLQFLAEIDVLYFNLLHIYYESLIILKIDFLLFLKILENLLFIANLLNNLGEF